MPRHLAFFLGALAFLSGIVYASLGLRLLYALVPAAFLFAALFVAGENWRISVLAGLLLLAGGFYYSWDDARYQALVSRLPREGEFLGMIVNDPRQGMGEQTFYLRTDAGNLLVKTGAVPSYFYGDSITASGRVQIPEADSYGLYLAKERVVGIMRNPALTRDSSGGSNKIFSILFRVKRDVQASFQKLFSPLQAAFLSGIMMGANENLPKQFSQDLALSGLRFLTAIDGLHIAIMAFIILSVCRYALPPRYAFLATFTLIALFIALTGFTASGVRAAIMASAASLAKESERLYDPKNALVLVALVLALFNPKVLVFDSGFQLSFLAVLAIIYFKPVLARLSRLDSAPDFWGLKDSLLIALSVQLAAAPVLIVQFQNFSLTAFVFSVFAVIMLPYLLASGFLLAIFSLILFPVAQLLSFVVAPLIAYFIFIVNLSARWAVPFNPRLSVFGIAAYYGLLIFLMFWFYRAKSVSTSARTDALIKLKQES